MGKVDAKRSAGSQLMFGLFSSQASITHRLGELVTGNPNWRVDLGFTPEEKELVKKLEHHSRGMEEAMRKLAWRLKP